MSLFLMRRLALKTFLRLGGQPITASGAPQPNVLKDTNVNILSDQSGNILAQSS